MTVSPSPDPATSPVSPTATMSAVEARLREALSDGVRSDLGSRALYTSDASLYRILPGLVVAPADVEELARVVASAARRAPR